MHYNQPGFPPPDPMTNAKYAPYATNPSNASYKANVIEVTGEGTVSVPPDKAVVELGAVTEGFSLTAAQKENAETVTRIIDALIQLGLSKENIQTSQYRIEREYNFEEGKQIFRGYKVTHLLQVTIPKIEQTGLIIDTAVIHGANSISNIEFATEHSEAYYNQALTLALKNGEQKALTIARTLGASLNKFPGKVQELSRALEPTPYPIQAFAKSAATPIQPGELKISASVRIVYFFV